MSAKHAVLGLLIERPGHGYDVAQRLRARFGSSGFAPTGVYSALDQLSGEGLVCPADAHGGLSGEQAAQRTIYEATARGREQFDRWMLADSSVANIRDELNMKITLSRPRDLPALIELARVQEQQCLTRLNVLRSAETAAASRSRGRALSWPQVADLLVRDAEVRQLQARIEWLQRAAAIMAKLVGSQRCERPGHEPEASDAQGLASEARVA